MKIKELKIRNFSSHANTAMALERQIGVIVGQLAAGKSSIAQAIEYALCGETGYYRKRTDDRSQLVRNRGGDGPMRLELVTDRGSAVRMRTGLDNVEASDWNGVSSPTPSAMEASVVSAMGVSLTVLSALLNTGDFFNLAPAAQKEIIIGLIGAEITDEKLRAAWTGEPEALALLKGRVDSVKALDNAYDYVFEHRKTSKRELKELRPAVLPEGVRPDLDKMRNKLARLEDEEKTAIGERGRLQGAQSVPVDRTRIERRIKELEDLIAVVLERPEQTMKDIQRVEKEQKEARESASTVERRIIDLRVKLETITKNGELLSKFNGRCVAGDHACPAPAADMEKARAAQEALGHQVINDLKMEQLTFDKLCKVRDDQTTLKDLQKKMSDLGAKINARVGYQGELKILKEELAKEAPVVDTSAVDALTEKINELRERIKKGKEVVEGAHLWIQREKDVADVAEKRKQLEIEVRYLEGLVEFLGPKGIRVELIDDRIVKFVEQVDVHLKAFGFGLGVKVEPWELSVHERPVGRLSTSERYRLGVALQIAIARMTGFNFIICDGTEILTPAVFTQLMKMIAGSGLDQAIVIKTLMTPDEEFKKKPPKATMIEAFVVANENGVSVVEKI